MSHLRTPRILLLAVVSLVAALPALAHDPLASWTVATLKPGRLELQIAVSAESAWPVIQRTLAPGKEFLPEDFEDVGRPLLTQYAIDHQVVSVDGVAVNPSEVDAELEHDGFNLHLLYPLPEGRGLLTIRQANLEAMPASYQTHLTVIDSDGEVIASRLLDAIEPSIEITVEGEAPPVAKTQSTSFGRYLLLGFEHILIGYDHLLFLAGLLILCTKVRSMLFIITSFTVAHSITLALAALDVVSLSSRLAEAAIAASIVYVAVENLIRRGEPQKRWILTFIFGLIHGFGFAGMLREIGLGAGGSSIAGPLLAFNLGIEIGQITIASIVLPAWWFALKRWKRLQKSRVIVSALIALAGAWWLWERLAAFRG